MRVTSGEGYLALERTDDPDFPYLHLSALVQTRRGRFCGENDGVFYAGGQEGLEAFARFRSFESNEIRIELTEGCWLDIRRLTRGNLRIDFAITIVGNDGETTMSGHTGVDGEFARGLLDELAKVIA